MQLMPHDSPDLASAPDARPGLIFTALGPDRPGLVNAIAGFVTRRGGNIEDTRMAKLGGEFAVLVLVTGSSANLAALQADQSVIAAELGVHCFFKPTHKALGSAEGVFCKLSLRTLDRPGIVESVTEVLSSRQVNVASLSSRVVHAAETGTQLFELEAELLVPLAVDPQEVARALDAVSERDNLDLVFTVGRG